MPRFTMSLPDEKFKILEAIAVKHQDSMSRACPQFKAIN